MIAGHVVCGWASNTTSAVDDLQRREGDVEVDAACGASSADRGRRRGTDPAASGRGPRRGSAAGRRRGGRRGPGTRGRGGPRGPSGSGGRIGVGAEHGHCRTRRSAAAVDPGYRHAMAIEPFTLHGAARRAGPARRRARRRARPRRPAATARRTGSPRCRRRRARWPTTSTACSPSATPARRCRSPSAGSPTAGSSAAPASWSCAGGAAATNPTRWRSAAPGWPPTPSARPINTEAKLLLLDHAFDVWQRRRGWPSPPTSATSAAGRRSSASAPASRARCATTARRSSPARPGGPGTRRCSRITDDDWPAVRARPGAAPAHRLRSATLMEVLRRLRPPPRRTASTTPSPRRPRAGFERAGHDVTTLDLYALGFAAGDVAGGAPGVPRRAAADRPDDRRPRRARPAAPTCSCSSTRRGGAGRRRCSRAGSSGCSCPAWRSASTTRARCARR